MSISLFGLNEALEKMDVSSDLRHAVMDKSRKNTLEDWWVPVGRRGERTSLVEALKTAIQTAVKDNPNSYFIDISQLSPPGPTEVVKARVFNDIEDDLKVLLATGKTVTIRYFEGCDNPPKDKEAFKDYAIVSKLIDLAKEYENLSLYCGYNRKARIYEPKKTKLSSTNSIVNHDAVNAIELSNAEDNEQLSEIKEELKSFMINLIKDLVAKALPIAPSWNHAKIFAINGSHMVQGGANFWNDYLNLDCPVDLATAFEGYAAVGGHNFCNELWNNLALKRLIPVENGSILAYKRGKELTGPIKLVPSFSEIRFHPFSASEVVAANTLGMLEVGGVTGITRDVFMNAVFLFIKRLEFIKMKNAAAEKDPAKRGSSLLKFYGLALEFAGLLLQQFPNTLVVGGVNVLQLIGKELASGVSGYNQYYVGRYARNYAMRNASSFIGLSQHKLGLDESEVIDPLAPYLKSIIMLGANEVTDVNNKQYKPDDVWNSIWYKALFPMDSMMALAKASKKKKMEIQIVLSTKESKPGGYNDSISDETYLSIIEDLGGTRDNVNIKRTSGRANHSKLTIIDKSLFNVGSENFYPSYNQEFSLWIQEKLEGGGILHTASELPPNGFMKNYWVEFWNSPS